MSDDRPERGEVWTVDLRPVRGHEQGEERPAVVVSANGYNRSRADLVVVAPITSKNKGIPLHVSVSPPEGGLKMPSVILCDQVRSVSKERLGTRWGKLAAGTMSQVDDRIRVVLDL